MARKIIVLKWADDPGRDREVTAAFWCDVPVARRPYWVRQGNTAALTSAVVDAAPLEVTALQTGAVREVVAKYSDTGTATTAQIQAFLQARHAEFQAETTAYNPWKFAGSSWDGTTWTIASVG